MNTKNLKRLQCPLCIELRYGTNLLDRHLFTVHNQTVEQVCALYEKYGIKG